MMRGGINGEFAWVADRADRVALAPGKSRQEFKECLIKIGQLEFGASTFERDLRIQVREAQQYLLPEDWSRSLASCYHPEGVDAFSRNQICSDLKRLRGLQHYIRTLHHMPCRNALIYGAVSLVLTIPVLFELLWKFDMPTNPTVGFATLTGFLTADGVGLASGVGFAWADVSTIAVNHIKDPETPYSVTVFPPLVLRTALSNALSSLPGGEKLKECGAGIAGYGAGIARYGNHLAKHYAFFGCVKAAFELAGTFPAHALYFLAALTYGVARSFTNVAEDELHGFNDRTKSGIDSYLAWTFYVPMALSLVISAAFASKCASAYATYRFRKPFLPAATSSNISVNSVSQGLLANPGSPAGDDKVGDRFREVLVEPNSHNITSDGSVDSGRSNTLSSSIDSVLGFRCMLGGLTPCGSLSDAEQIPRVPQSGAQASTTLFDSARRESADSGPSILYEHVGHVG